MSKRWTALAAAVPVAVAGVVGVAEGKAPNHATAAPEKVTICHKTESNTFRRITVSSRAWTNPKSRSGKTLRGHMRHVGDAIVVGNEPCLSPSLTPQESDQAPAKVTICHATHSKKNPFRRITVSSRAVTNTQSQSGNVLRGHARHEGDILMPGTTACPSGSTGQSGQAVQLSANLAPVSGAAGSGNATVTIRVPKSELCFALNVSNLGSPVTVAHIHRGSTTNVVVPLLAAPTGTSSGCVDVEKALLRELVASPGAFYVNVHTDAFPNGQVSGDLSK